MGRLATEHQRVAKELHPPFVPVIEAVVGHEAGDRETIATAQATAVFLHLIVKRHHRHPRASAQQQQSKHPSATDPGAHRERAKPRPRATRKAFRKGDVWPWRATTVCTLSAESRTISDCMCSFDTRLSSSEPSLARRSLPPIRW